MIYPDNPAFPYVAWDTDSAGETRPRYSEPGMTIRAEIASRIMAGFAAKDGVFGYVSSEAKGLHSRAAAEAVAWADALISELNKGETP